MQFKRFALLVGFLLAAAGSAQAQPRDRVLIPAPIPDYGAVAVPAGVPVPDGFTYYLRADLGWAFANSISYRETGAEFGGVPISFSQLSNRRTSIDDVFIGTVGAGAYFTPRLRVSYRALYLEAGSVTVSMSTGENSMVTLGNIWEHQARVGLRYNIW